MKNLKIGITLSLESATDSLWGNGMQLNAVILARMLQRSPENYTVALLNIHNVDFKTANPMLEGVPIRYLPQSIHDFDLLFIFGGAVENSLAHEFKQRDPNRRIVSYRGGNDYLFFTESVLFQDSAKKPYDVKRHVDEVWYVPQQHETCSGFWRTLNRANVLPVPFAWSHHFLDQSLAEIRRGHASGRFKRDVTYQPKQLKAIGIMEPNINLVKFGLIPLMIAEECYRGAVGQAHIDYVMLTNAKKLATHKQFMDVVKTFDLFRDKKISAEARYQTAFLLSQHVDILICHQLLNPLNYLYLDAAYMGFPVLHNAPMVRDLGYYYEGSDTRAAARQLDRVLTEHDQHLGEYHAQTAAVLRRYDSAQLDLIASYDRLIERLFNGGNHGLDYDAATNRYRNG